MRSSAKETSAQKLPPLASPVDVTLQRVYIIPRYHLLLAQSGKPFNKVERFQLLPSFQNPLITLDASRQIHF
jgi:hypothetical protein